LYSDKVSKFLPFDYDDKCNNQIKNKIKNIISNISNNDDELIEFNLNWLGYCLTGETDMQKFLCIVGHTASNGKSTLIKMFSSSFSSYCKKSDGRTFSSDYTKAHKQFADIKQPIRLIYAEELDRKRLDNRLLKDFVDGDKIGSNEVLYGTTEDINLQCKHNSLLYSFHHI
jgi:phage/plasmid-associated DNA primase